MTAFRRQLPTLSKLTEQCQAHREQEDIHQSTIEGMEDANIVLPLASQALVYDAIAGKWQNTLIPVAPAGSGRLQQVKFGSIPALSGTTQIELIDTAPVITQGTELWTDIITLTDVTSLVRIHTSVTFVGTTSSMELVWIIYRDATPIGAVMATIANRDSGAASTVTVYDNPGSIGPHVYSMRVGKTGGPGTWYMNSHPDFANPYGGILQNNAYSIEEIGTS